MLAIINNLAKIANLYTYFNNFSRISCNNTVRWNIFCNNSASSNDDMIPNPHTRKYD